MEFTGKCLGIVLLILMVISGSAMAQNGGGNGNGSCGIAAANSSADGADQGGLGTGNCVNVRTRAQSRLQSQILVNAVPVTVTGVVVTAAYAGSGLVIDTGSADGLMTTVYGIGPQWYWDALGISRPDVGEEVEIDALKITLSDGTDRLIATTVIILGNDTADDIVVELRDDSGRPLWRSIGNGQNSGF